MDIGFIGLGQIGSPIARRLSASANRLVVCDRQRDACAPFEEQGIEAVSTGMEIAQRASLIFTCLPSEDSLREVVLGRHGIREGSAVRTVVDLSTVGANAAVELARELESVHIGLLDCPVSGGVQGAERGDLTLMVSGPKPVYESVREVLTLIGRPFFLGEKRGAAQTMKLINNLLSATALAVTAEAFVLGEKAGLDPTMMIDILNSGTGRNSATQTKFPCAVLPRTFRAGAATGLMVKDVSLYLDEACASGVQSDIASAVFDKWKMVESIAGAQSDFTEIVRVLERQAGIGFSH
ncbi:NAD(P)-dependent oxidoreductase [Paraburkholderia sp.]|uniref:NAD(P)-dependent oxidoreductase n=1 Tax=Paraburkholderia sp. TaxID=1926495 RepID=UPI0039E4725C